MAAPIIFNKSRLVVFIVVGRLARMARVTIDIGLSSLVAIDTPSHGVSIDHLQRPLPLPGEAVANGTVDLSAAMQVVGENDEGGKLVHASPWNLFSLLDVFHHLEGLGPLAYRIGGMADPAELDVWEASDPVVLRIAVAERALQLGHLLMVNVIEEHGLIDGDPGKDGK